MKSCQKYFSTCLVATAALFSAASFQAALAQTGAPPLSDRLQNFAVLGATVTCTDSLVIGDAGISPATAFTNTRCTFTGRTPTATNTAAVGAKADFLSAYATIRTGDCTQLVASDIPGQPNNTGNTPGRNISTLADVTLAPGTYCVDDVAKAGLLTLSGPADGIWIFKVIQSASGALTGTGFTVTMTGGGQACNVFWAPATAATMTTSAFKGNILAGNASVGSITLTNSPVDGRALANVAVTMTDSVIGCGGLGALSDSLSCKPGERLVCKPTHRHHGGKDDDDDDDDDGKKNKNDKKPLPTNTWWKHFFN
jgi:hypothetical protein